MTKLQAYLDKKTPKDSIKTFEQAFEFACQIHPVWNLSREKKSQAENVRRNYDQLNEHMDGERIPLKLFDGETINNVTADIKDERDWTDGTANKFLSFISKTFKILADKHLIEQIPHIVRYNEEAGRTQWFTHEQVDLLWDIANKHDRSELADLILFAAYTGMRQGEIRKLRAVDFEFRADVPYVHVGGTPETRTKTNNYRQVGLHDRLVPMAHRLLDGAQPHELIFGKFWNSRQKISRQWNVVRRLSMYQDDTISPFHVFHTLRHSFGTWQIAAGTPVMHVKQTMGHSNIKTTERYVHNTFASVANCANNI